MKSIVRSELLVHVPELASGVAQEHPACDAVAKRAEVEEKQQDGANDHPSVPVEEEGFEWGEKGELAGRPGDDQERYQRRCERSIRRHCFVSSNA
jgi:hypothetical protein